MKTTLGKFMRRILPGVSDTEASGGEVMKRLIALVFRRLGARWGWVEEWLDDL